MDPTMILRFVPRHFVPGKSNTKPTIKSVAAYIETNIGANNSGPHGGFVPRGVGNCVIKAVSAVENIPYSEALTRFRTYKPRGGTKHWEVMRYFDGGERKVGGYYSRVVDGEVSTVMGVAKRYTSGKYMVLVRGHVVSVIDGVIMDDWNSSKRRVTRMWKWIGA